MGCRVVSVFLIAVAVVCRIAAGTCCAQSAPSDREFEDAFMLYETSELIDDVIKEGDRFNLPKELRDLQQKYERTFGRPITDRLLGDFEGSVRRIWDTPPEARPPRKKALPPSPDLFFAEERVRVLAKTRKEGDQFDPAKELSKIAERYEKKFGAPLPEDLRNRYLRDAQVARALVPPAAGVPAEAQKQTPAATSKPTASAESGSSRHVRSLYRDGLPEWFRQRDENHDGQLGLYEWPRSQIDDFRRFDLNHDGFLVQTEVLRVTGVTTAGSSRSSATTSDARRNDRR